MGPFPPAVQNVTGNSGGPIFPNQSGNLRLVGTGVISVSGSGNTLTIGGGNSIIWNANSTTQTMVANNGYFVTSSTLQTLALPNTANVGDVVEVIWVYGAGGWTIAQQAGQQIIIGSRQTTPGASGSLTSTAVGNVIHLVCMTPGASSGWIVDFYIGNLTVV